MTKTITTGPDQGTVTMKKIVVRRTGAVRLTTFNCYGYGCCSCR